MRTLSLALFLSGCGTCSVHPDFLPEIRELLAATAHLDTPPGYNHMCSVEYADLPGDTLGLCVQYPSGYNDVYIRPGLSPTAQRWVLWHELGHCLWLLDHTASDSGIMQPKVGGDDLARPWAEVREEFVNYLTRTYPPAKLKQEVNPTRQ